ncbi:hypothetical protein EE612_008990, partial [Oryza sativa]
EDASLLRPRPEPPPTMRASGAAVGAAAPYPPPPLPILRCLSATALAHRRCFSAATLAHRSRCSAIVLARRHRRSACSGRPSGGRRHGCTSVARAVGGCGGGVGGGPPTPMSSLPLRRPSPIAGRPTSSLLPRSASRLAETARERRGRRGDGAGVVGCDPGMAACSRVAAAVAASSAATLSPVTPLVADPFNRSPASASTEEEAAAIALAQ